MQVLQATLSHYEAVHYLMHQVFKPPYAYDRITIIYLIVEKSCKVAIVDDMVVGFVFYVVRQSEIDAQPIMTITGIGVKPELQRQKIGIRLLGNLLHDIPLRKGVGLHVRETNHSAIAMYEKCGFIQVKYLPGFYIDTNPPENAIYMIYVTPLKGDEFD